MFLKTIHKIYRKLAFKLTLWYAIIFVISLLSAFSIFYFTAKTALQRNMDNELLGDLAEISATYKLMGKDATLNAINIEGESEGIDDMFLRLIDLKGNVIIASNMKYWKNISIDQNALNRISDGEPHIFEMQTIPGKHDKTRIMYGKIDSETILQIGFDLKKEENFLRSIIAPNIPILLFFVILSAVTGWFMATRALSDVAEVTKTAQQILQGAFDQRVRVESKSEEIKLLSETFNRMLDHIQNLMRGLRDVMDNIAHDLKTPITRMRVAAETELNISLAEGTEESRKLAAGTIEECDNLIEMINTMLMISKEESGLSRNEKKQVNLSQIIKDAFELFSSVMKEKGIQYINKVPDNVEIIGDLNALQRMIINLLDNAVKYTPSGGTVSVYTQIKDDAIKIGFEDTGIGISGEDMPHIFERFYRCDPSRSQQGFGLGLSLALAIAKAHLGNITVISEVGKGSTFTVTLPR